MRRLIGVMTIAMGLGLGMSGVSHAQTIAPGGITGSSHDFTDGFAGKRDAGSGTAVAFDESWNLRGEICRVCHVPHDHGRASQRYLNGLLWNHAVSTANYTMYDSSTMDADAPTGGPDGHSKLCLGCHDGTVGIDTFDRYAGGTVHIDDYDAGYQVPGFVIGGTLDMTGTHPISIPYSAGDTKLQPTSVLWASGDSVLSTLDNGKVQCSTCHDVHAQESVVGTHLLRQAQTVAQGGLASQLCLTCHIK